MWVLAVALGLIFASAPSVAAQDANRTYRVGFVGPYSPGLDWSILQGYQERLRELGWVEGQNIVTTYRWADGDFSRFPGLVDSIMSAPPDLLVLPCGPAIKTARDLSPAIPIVACCIDLKDFGREIDTVARPGGFTTGVTYFSPGATRRRLELLKELVPNLSRVGVLYQSESSWASHWDEVEAAARAAGVGLERLEWKPSSDPGGAFHIAVKRRLGALMVLGDGAAHLHRHAIFSLAAERRVPVIYDFPMVPAADDVGLMAYYVGVGTLFRSVAEQVDQILRGGKPGDIPVAFPQKFRLVINARAARALGLAIPPSLRQRADEVID